MKYQGMNRREFLRQCGLGCATAAAMGIPHTLRQAFGAPSQVAKPNIIFFLGDDHSYFDVGYDGNAVVQTPTIDQLAREGMRFTRAYVPTAMCAPSRSTLYTGLYPHRHGCHMNHGASKPGIRSLPHYLKPLGYRVVLAGKRHIKPQSVYPFEYIPTSKIGEVIQGKTPYCLIIASDEPHGPHTLGQYKPADVPIPPYLADTPAARHGRAGYYGDIDLLEKEIAHTLQLLKKSGQEDNTLFIYAGDHGNGLMAKWTCYDAGLRVPFVARWPGHIKPGSVSNAMIGTIDIVPTCIALAGGTPPKGLDGKSLMPVLEGKTKKHHSLIFGCHTNQGIILGTPYPVRSVFDGRYQYIRNLAPAGRPHNVLTQSKKGAWVQWQEKAKTSATAKKLARRVLHRPAEELYDVTADPWELKNLAASPKHAATKKRLSAELDQWMKAQGDDGMKAELRVKPHRTMRPAKK